MSGYQDRIQGTDRLPRIRRLRNVVLAALLVLTVLLIFARMESQGASLKPFFLPVNGIFEVGLGMALVGAFVGLFLQRLEIKHIQRDNHRYNLAKARMTRAVRTAGFSIGLAIILLLAFAPTLAASLLSDPPQVISLGTGEREIVTFTSPDPFGLSFVTGVVVDASDFAYVSLARNNVTITGEWLNATQRVTLSVEPTVWESRADWSLDFENWATNGTTYLRFILEKALVPTLFSTVPFLLFLYGGAQVASWAFLRPIRERTKSGSLYANPEIGEGERVYDPSAPTPNPPRADRPAASMASNFAGPPPSPPRVNPPAPPLVVPSIPPTTSTKPPTVPRPMKEPAPAPRPTPPPRTPDTADSLTRKGEDLVATGANESALAAFEEALRLQADHLRALRGRAGCLVRVNRRPEAIEAHRRILSIDPKNLDSLRALVRLFAEDRRWRECLEVTGELLRLRPNDAAAMEMKGDALTNLGRRAEALAAYEAAASLDPKDENLRQKIEEVRVDVPGLLSRALIASASGNYPRALGLFDDILEVEPSNVNALIGKAVAYRRSGKPQEALNCLDLVLGVQPNNASALLNRGNIFLQEGDPEAALEMFDRLTQLYPNDEEAWAAQGEVLVKMGRDDDALRAFTEAQKLSPGDEAIQRRILELEVERVVQEDILGELVKIKGVGQARAKALIEAGFASAGDFANATAKDLMAVRGVTRKIAEDLVEHFAAKVEPHGAEQVLK